MKYKRFSIEDFAVDEYFQEWVLFPNEDSKEFWGKFLQENPSKNEAIYQARNLVLALYVKNEKRLFSEGELEEKKIKVVKTVRQAEHRQQPLRKWYLGAAAVVFLFILSTVAWYYYPSNQKKVTPPVDITFIEKSTEKGQKSTFTLPDGTIVRLNSSTTLKIVSTFGKTQRLVHLEGEAFFDVAEDASQPFKIITGDVETVVLGTSFNVRAYPGEIQQIAVATGKVAVNRGANLQAIQLLPGEMVKVKVNLFEKGPYDTVETLGWKDGIIVFKDASIHDIARRLERWFDVEITFERNVRKDITYTGKFENENLVNILEAIKYSEDFNYELKDKNITIY